jgi:(p)ppGpp synthase/HD superfamily hydrolase
MFIESFSVLITLAKERGYSNENIELIKRAYDIASVYSINLFRYRIKTRPFINHLISVCSILMYSTLNIETVVAGLLHSVKNDMPRIYNLHNTVGEIVDKYFDPTTGAKEQIQIKNTNNIDWVVIAIQLANTTDMIMAGEYKSPE